MYVGYSCKSERFFAEIFFRILELDYYMLQNMSYHINLSVLRRNGERQPHQSVWVSLNFEEV